MSNLAHRRLYVTILAAPIKVLHRKPRIALEPVSHDGTPSEASVSAARHVSLRSAVRSVLEANCSSAGSHCTTSIVWTVYDFALWVRRIASPVSGKTSPREFSNFLVWKIKMFPLNCSIRSSRYLQRSSALFLASI